jgi:hypothetical protein
MISLSERYGPLYPLIGIWEGDKGHDTAPSETRAIETNLFRERIIFEEMSPVQNHEQVLNVLRYKTTAWKITGTQPEAQPFHEELGYWSYEPAQNQVMRNFIVPRGTAVIAGGTAKPNATRFELSAKYGSHTFGICVNPFLDREFRIVEYTVLVELLTPTTLKYSENTLIQIKGKTELFHHRDENVLNKIK